LNGLVGTNLLDPGLLCAADPVAADIVSDGSVPLASMAKASTSTSKLRVSFLA
jgi:hypothetical protein